MDTGAQPSQISSESEALRRANEQAGKDNKDNQSVREPPPPYRESYLAYFQAEQIKALLLEWDGAAEKDPAHPGLHPSGSVSHDSADFTRKSENLSFSSVAQIPSRWRKRVTEINDALAAAGKPTVEITSLLDRPKEFTNFVLGYDGNEFGNRPGTDDGWEFRPRGMYQLVGHEQYKAAEDRIRELRQLEGLDLLHFPMRSGIRRSRQK